MAIFLDVLPRLGLREAEVVVSQAKSLFAGAGKDIGASFGEGPAVAMKRMQEEYGRTAGVATETSRAMIRANTEVETSTKALGAATATYGAQATQTANAERALTEARIASLGATRTHNAAMNDAVAAQTAATASTTSHGNAVAATAGVLNKVGIASVVGFTAAVVESAKKAGDFQQSQTKIIASTSETAQGLKTVSDGILQMAGQVGYSAQQLSEGMYTVEKAGFRGADAVGVMKAAAQGAKAENADLTEVNNGLTTSMNDFHIPAANAADVMSKMVVATGAAKTTFQDFSGSLHSVEPAAAAAGIKLEDVYAVLARVTQSGASAQQTTENMRNAINSLSAPTSVMRDNMAKFGISADDVSQHLSERGLSGSLQLISDRIRSRMSPAQQTVVSDMYANAQATKDATQMIKDMSPAAAKLASDLQSGAINHQQFAKATRGSTQDDYAKLQAFGVLENKLVGYSSNLKKGQDTVETYNRAMKDATGTVAAQTIALQVTGENADATNKLVAQLTNTTREHDGTVKGFNETQDTLNAKLADAKAGFGAAAIQLGNVFIPALTDAAHWLSNVATFLAEHKRIAEAVAIAVGGIGAAWVIVKGYMVFDTIITGLGRMATAMFGVKTETLAVNTELRAQGLAAAEGEAGVLAASTAEVAAVGRVTAAATIARNVLSTVAVGAAAALVGVQVANQVVHSDRLAQAEHNNPLAQNPVSKWINQHTPSWLGGDPHWQNDDPVPRPATDPQANADEVNRRLAASGVGPLAPQLTPPPTVPPSTDPQANADEVNRRLAASGVGPLAPPRTSPSTASSAGNPKAPAGTRGDPVYTSSANPTPTSQTGSGVNSLFAPLAQDFGISGGLPGVVQWLTTLLGNMAIASIAGPLGARVGTSSTLGANASAPVYVSDVNAQTGYSTNQLRDMLAQNKVDTELQKAQAAAAKYGPDSPQAQRANLAVTRAQEAQQNLETQQSIPSGSGSRGYAGDAALLANVPTGGQYVNPGGTFDLSKGLADCSSAVGDLVKTLDGTRTGGGDRLNTGNASTWLPAHGFLPGSMPGAFNVGFDSGHMQATLPGGTPFNWGSDAAAARGGVGGTGAFDPAFTSHYYRPVGPSAGSGGVPAASGGPTAGDVAQANAGANFPLSSFFGGGGNSPVFRHPWTPDPGNFGQPDPTGKTPLTGPYGHYIPGVGVNPVTNDQGNPLGPFGGPWAKGWGGDPSTAPVVEQGRAPASADKGAYAPRSSSDVMDSGSMWPDWATVMQHPPSFGGGSIRGGMPTGMGFRLDTPGPFPNPGGPGGQPPGQIGPFGVPPGVAAAAPMVGSGATAGIGAIPGAPPSSGMDSLAPTAVPGAGSGAGIGLSGPASLAPTAPPSGGGGGADGGGLIGAAAGMMPGGQVAAALATRAVKFGAQAAGILVGGALETFLPHDSPLADPGKSWFGKIAAGFSGARPASPNAAGQTPPPQNAQQQQQGQQQHKGTGAPPGPTNGVYIENMNNHGADGQGVASDIARAQYAQYQAGGPR